MCHDIDPLESVPVIVTRVYLQHRPCLSVISWPLWTVDPNIFGLQRFADGRQCTSLQFRYVSCCASFPYDSWLIRCNVGQIEVLPDDVLLAIFDFCVVAYPEFPRSGDDHSVIIGTGDISQGTVEWWQPLVHVCRRWRVLVFGSPRRLNLRLWYTFGVRRKTLD